MSHPWDCAFRAHPSSRRISITYRGNGRFVVTYPRGISRKRAEAFVQSRVDWMNQVASVPGTSAQTLGDHLQTHPFVTVMGRQIPVHWTNLYPEDPFQNLTLIDHFPLFDNGERSLVKQLTGLAAAALPPRVIEFAARTKVPPVKAVSIRNQRARWGSCSNSGTISLNWRLVLMPPDLQDHIILHELAHLVHMDHSTSFWALLESWDPLFKTNRKTLKRMGKQWIHLAQ